jgi:uncharacterized protein (DUF302 family)
MRWIVGLVCTLGLALAQNPNGFVAVKSANGMAATQAKLEAAIKQANLILVMVIDHSANAQSVGLELRPTRLVIFENPRAGTPLMQSAQSVAIDLPQKMLIWQNQEGEVWLGYNDPLYLKQRHSIAGQDERLAAISTALANLSKAAAAP